MYLFKETKGINIFEYKNLQRIIFDIKVNSLTPEFCFPSGFKILPYHIVYRLIEAKVEIFFLCSLLNSIDIMENATNWFT